MKRKIFAYVLSSVLLFSTIHINPAISYGQNEIEISNSNEDINLYEENSVLAEETALNNNENVDVDESRPLDTEQLIDLGNVSSLEEETENNNESFLDSEEILDGTKENADLSGENSVLAEETVEETTSNDDVDEEKSSSFDNEQLNDSDNISDFEAETENSNEAISNFEEQLYAYSATSTSGTVTLKVEWNEPILGQDTMFYVSATGGSGNYKFRMDAPSYSNPGESAFESVADPSRGEWTQYTEECSSHDYSFTMTASGTYNFRFYVMDKQASVYYLRVSTNIQVFDNNFPSVKDIISSAVFQCGQETDGSEYEKALWLHDWLIQQLDYDNSLKWSSAESALTRKLGTCQAYESAYSQLLTAAGIENAETRDTYDGHTWNAMKLDGEWYQVDCTWDDTKDNYYNFDSTHLYFGLTDELMAIAHKGHNNIYTDSNYSTRSTSLYDNYFVKTGEAHTWAQTYIDRICEKLNEKETEFKVIADNSSYPPSISGIQNGIIAYALNQMDWFSHDSQVELQVNGTATEFVCVAKYSECEHVWDSGVVIKNATDDQEGIIRYTCIKCAETKDVSFSNTGNSRLELDMLAENNKDVIEDGIYYIETSLSSDYIIGIKDGSINDLANIELQKKTGLSSQQWKVTHDEKGYVCFENVKSGKMLDLDKGKAANFNRVQQYVRNNLNPQKWIVIQDDKGMRIIPSSSRNFSLDLNKGNISEGATIQLYEDLNNQPQRWKFTKVKETYTMDDVAQEYKETIEDGIYYIETSLNSDYIIGIKDGSINDLANIELQKKTGLSSQQWKVTHDEKGYVCFENVKSGKMLDLDKGKAANFNRVQQYVRNNLNPQKWIVIQDDKGMRIIPSSSRNFSLDLNKGNISEGATIQLYEDLNNQPQRWKFTKVKETYTMDDVAQEYKETIEDGIYYIETSLNSDYIIGIKDGSINDLANIELQKKTGLSSQQWKVTHDEKGYVCFENVKSGKMLDLDKGKAANFNRVQQYVRNNLNPQKWIVIQDDKGIRIIPSSSRNFSLDLNKGNISEGAVIQLYEDLDNQPQRWKFTKVTEETDRE